MLRFILIAAVLLSFPVLGSGQSVVQDCQYEKLIYQLAEKRKIEPVQAERGRALSKYLAVRNQLDDLDRYTQFEITIDQDAGAELKFKTPEEKLKESISSLSSWISWLNGHAEAFASTIYKGSKTIELGKAALDKLDKLEKGVTWMKSFSKQKKDKADALLKEFWTMVDTRNESIAGLDALSNQMMCVYLSDTEWQLAKLYHEIIPNDNNCNELERKALLDRIKRIDGIGMGFILNKSNYDQVKDKCGAVVIDALKPAAKPSPSTPTGTTATGEAAKPIYTESWHGKYEVTPWDKNSVSVQIYWYADGSIKGNYKGRPLKNIQAGGGSYSFEIESASCVKKMNFDVVPNDLYEIYATGFYKINCPGKEAKEYKVRMDKLNKTGSR